MLDDPGVDVGAIAACLGTHYGLEEASVAFLPVGHDPYAAVYEAVSPDGGVHFLKVRFGPVNEAGLLVPRALIDLGVRDVLAPLRTRSDDLWCPLDGDSGFTVVLYPFVRGENAKVVGMTDEQWRAFGATLHAVHASGLGERFRDRLPAESFALPSAALVRRLSTLVDEERFERGVAARLAAFWRERAAQIDRILARAEALGTELQATRFERVLCHTDIHAANILVGEDGGIVLIDWDSPLVAPRERDLLFVVGSRIAREVEPRDETHFFEGYGPVAIDPTALVYYRYERIVEDIGEFGKSVFLNPTMSEEARVIEAELAMGFFAPGGDVERAELVDLSRVPAPSA